VGYYPEHQSIKDAALMQGGCSGSLIENNFQEVDSDPKKEKYDHHAGDRASFRPGYL